MGIKQWSKNVEVTANPSKRIRQVNLSFSTAIASGASSMVSVYAPTGYVSRIINMYLRYPSIAAAISGEKKIYVSPAGGAFGLIDGTGAYNASLSFEYYQWLNSTARSPADLTALANVLEFGYFDASNFIAFMFSNLTDVADGGVTKTLQLLLLDEKIS